MAIGGVFEMLPTEGNYLFILCFTIFHCIVQLLSSDGELVTSWKKWEHRSMTAAQLGQICF